MWQVDSANCSFLTHKDTFMHTHLTKQPTGNWTDTSLSARRLLFSEIAAPTVIKPGSHFLSFCCSNGRSALWVRMKATTGTSSDPSPCPPLQGAVSQLSHFLYETAYTTVLSVPCIKLFINLLLLFTTQPVTSAAFLWKNSKENRIEI